MRVTAECPVCGKTVAVTARMGAALEGLVLTEANKVDMKAWAVELHRVTEVCNGKV